MAYAPLAAAELDPRRLLALLDRYGTAGVLSIFADVAPGSRGTEIDLRNRLTELERRVSANGSSAGVTALKDVLPRLRLELKGLVDPAADGRGRALFVPLSGDAPTQLVTHLATASRVVLDERPFIHPLLECLERGRPAGVVLLSSQAAQVL